MQLNEDQNKPSYQLQSYHAGTFIINDTRYEHSLILTCERLIHPWRPISVEVLCDKDLQPIIDLKPEIVLLGTGEHHCQLPEHKIATLINAGIAVEVMSTAAACRTFMLLAADDRAVAAALLIN